MRVTADMLLYALERRHRRDHIFFANVQNGPAWGSPSLRYLDALAIKPSWARPELIGYEIKVSRHDFLRDSKWPDYLKVTHRFYWACPAGMIQPEEVDERTGLVWWNPETGQTRVRKAAPFRDIEMPWQIFYAIVINRFKPDRHPFFSDRRELLEEWVRDREDRKRLGELVGSKLARERDEAIKRAERAERKAQELEHVAEKWRRLEEIFEARGVRLYDWGWERRVVEVLSAGVDPGMVASLRSIASRLQEIVATLAVSVEESGGRVAEGAAR